MINNTIIVYEEDTAVRQAVKSTLEAEGYTVLIASDTPNLLALTADHLPWLLVLAEDATGSGPSQSIREKLPNPHMPIITLVGRHEGIRGLPHRADMIVTKPCNPQELKQFVQWARNDTEEGNRQECLPLSRFTGRGVEARATCDALRL